MHESRLAVDLVARAVAAATEGDSHRVRELRLWIGALSHVTAASLRDSFDRAAVGTPAQGAALSCEKSTDLTDARAQHVVLRSVVIEE